jgi:polyisoprenoid-binding protein YceI
VALGGGARAADEAARRSYAVDSSSSRVLVHLGRAGLMKLLGHEHQIEAKPVSGRVEVVAGDPARSSVVLRFDSAALAVVPGSEPAQDIPKVEERMRGPEVLEVARHPEIVFASTSVREVGGDGARRRLLVAGTLTLRGRPAAIEIPVEAVQKGDGLEARGEVALELRELGIEPPSVAGVVKVANRFRLELEIRARAAPRP